MIQIKAHNLRVVDKRVMLKHSLTRDVAVVIAIKTIVVIIAGLFVFGPGQRPKLDATSVETRLIGSAASSLQPRKP